MTSYQNRVVQTECCIRCESKGELEQSFFDKRNHRPITQTGLLCVKCYDIELDEYHLELTMDDPE